MIDFVLCGVYLLFALTGMTLIKLGSICGARVLFSVPIISLPLTWVTMLGFFCYGCSFLLFTSVISKMNVSLAIPILSAINSCGMIIIGIMLFNEVVSKSQYVGLVMIVLGTIVVGFKR